MTAPSSRRRRTLKRRQLGFNSEGNYRQGVNNVFNTIVINYRFVPPIIHKDESSRVFPGRLVWIDYLRFHIMKDFCYIVLPTYYIYTAGCSSPRSSRAAATSLAKKLRDPSVAINMQSHKWEAGKCSASPRYQGPSALRGENLAVWDD